MEELTRLIRSDMRPALGVTEPGGDCICSCEGEKLYKRRSYICHGEVE